MKRWLHWGILPNIPRRTYTNPSQALPKDRKWGDTSKVTLWDHNYTDTKTRQRHYQKGKWQSNNLDEYRCKISQQNIRKPNPTTDKRILGITTKLGSSQGHKDCSYTGQSMWHTTSTEGKDKNHMAIPIDV